VSGALPLDGELLVAVEGGKPPAVDAVLAALGKLALETATAICADVPESELERWWLVLSGSAWALSAPTASGAEVSAAEVLAEIQRTGKLWVSRGQGSAEGNFPEAAPPFVLAGDSPLVRALELRAPRLLSDLGEITQLAESEAPAPEIAPPEFHDLVVDPEPVAAPRTPGALRRWLGGLREMLGLGEPRSAPADPRASALLFALAELELDGDPVQSIELTKSRRAFRYRAAGRKLLVGLGEPRIARIAERAPRDQHALDVLVAAAVSEVNRALTEVTDAEELRALRALLQRKAD
jgi:hypothetical protein